MNALELLGIAAVIVSVMGTIVKMWAFVSDTQYSISCLQRYNDGVLNKIDVKFRDQDKINKLVDETIQSRSTYARERYDELEKQVAALREQLRFTRFIK